MKKKFFTFVDYARRFLEKVKKIEAQGWTLVDCDMINSTFHFEKDVKVKLANGKTKIKRKRKAVRMSQKEWHILEQASAAAAFGLLKEYAKPYQIQHHHK